MQSLDLPLEPRKQVLAREEGEAFLTRMRTFLMEQRTLILGTCQESVPTCNLMSFALVPGRFSLVMVTPNKSRKSNTLRRNGNVSLLVVDQAALAQDLKNGTAVTLNGRAREVFDQERLDLEEIFIARNPNLEAFARNDQSDVFCIDIHHLVAVTNFQELTELALPG
ncbi:MAG: pyridoxamine 5'-phosphate oxidase family protein [Desulfovermiculus sp.]|nr:pyridoxamine 5'-phosphate oxidase family protein [Desulfovermiculus sp.]